MVEIVIQFDSGKTISFIEEGEMWSKLRNLKRGENITINNIWYINGDKVACMWRKGV